MSERTLALEIISPDGIILSDEINELIINTVKGQIAILPSHAPIFTKLAEGEAVIRKSGRDDTIAVLGGFLEVTGNKVTILADYAVREDNIDTEKIEEAKKKAEDIIKNRKPGADITVAQMQLRRLTFETKIALKLRNKPKLQ